jgi:hypothetical protein
MEALFSLQSQSGGESERGIRTTRSVASPGNRAFSPGKKKKRPTCAPRFVLEGQRQNGLRSAKVSRLAFQGVPQQANIAAGTARGLGGRCEGLGRRGYDPGFSTRQPGMRLASGSGEKPPKTTEWIAPMRVQASIA